MFRVVRGAWGASVHFCSFCVCNLQKIEALFEFVILSTIRLRLLQATQKKR